MTKNTFGSCWKRHCFLGCWFVANDVVAAVLFWVSFVCNFYSSVVLEFFMRTFVSLFF